MRKQAQLRLCKLGLGAVFYIKFFFNLKVIFIFRLSSYLGRLLIYRSSSNSDCLHFLGHIHFVVVFIFEGVFFFEGVFIFGAVFIFRTLSFLRSATFLRLSSFLRSSSFLRLLPSSASAQAWLGWVRFNLILHTHPTNPHPPQTRTSSETGSYPLCLLKLFWLTWCNKPNLTNSQHY